MRKLTSFCWLSIEDSWVVKFFFSFSSPSNILPCLIFFQDVRDSISCINSSCSMKAHLVCLAKRFLQTNREDSFLIPVEGDCPTCSSTFLWRDLIKHDNQPEQTSDPNSDSPHWAEELNRYWKTKLLSSIIVHNLHPFFPLFHFSPLWETWHLRCGPEVYADIGPFRYLSDWVGWIKWVKKLIIVKSSSPNISVGCYGRVCLV